jgi:hypothetical protein
MTTTAQTEGSLSCSDDLIEVTLRHLSGLVDHSLDSDGVLASVYLTTSSKGILAFCIDQERPRSPPN